MTFVLDDRLARDTFLVGDLPLSRLLLMNDARWPWLILVPRQEGLVELTDLAASDRVLLIEEAASAANFLEREANPDKVNIGALGNIVRQFHLHVVARFASDPAWPGPVWGQGIAQPYDPAAAHARIKAARRSLALPSA